MSKKFTEPFIRYIHVSFIETFIEHQVDFLCAKYEESFTNSCTSIFKLNTCKPLQVRTLSTLT